MLKEVSAKEALKAAMEGTPALQIHKYHCDSEEELMVEDLTDKIKEILKRKDSRYLIDVPEEKTEKLKEEPKEEPRVELKEPAESEEKDSEPSYEMKQQEEESKPKPTLDNFHVFKGKAENKGGRPLKVDVGEIMALHRAGWPEKQIAEETKCSVTTVKKYINRTERESGIR